MGRRNEHSREELRQLAIEAAGAIVESDGLRGLTARKVAARLGYSPGSLYTLFENLDDLVLHVNAETLSRMHADLAATQTGGTQPATALAALAQAYLQFARQHRNRWLSMFEHRLAEPGTLPAWYHGAVAGSLRLVQVPLAQLLPGRDDDDLTRVAKTLWSAVHGICVLGLDNKLEIGGRHDAEALLDILIDTFVSGLTRSR